MSTGRKLGANRNSAGATNLVLFLVGLAAFFAGIHLATILQVNLLTNQTTYPCLGSGVPLAIGGVVLMVIASAAAKRKLVK
jgi:hypothetical protein